MRGDPVASKVVSRCFLQELGDALERLSISEVFATIGSRSPYFEAVPQVMVGVLAEDAHRLAYGIPALFIYVHRLKYALHGCVDVTPLRERLVLVSPPPRWRKPVGERLSLALPLALELERTLAEVRTAYISTVLRRVHR